MNPAAAPGLRWLWDCLGHDRGRFLGTGSAPLPVLAGPRVSAATVFIAIEVAASDTAASPPPARVPELTPHAETD